MKTIFFNMEARAKNPILHCDSAHKDSGTIEIAVKSFIASSVCLFCNN